MTLRTARHLMNVPIASGASEELALPNIEKQLIIPKFVTFVWPTFQPTGSMEMGLSYERDRAAITAVNGIIQDDNVWVSWIWNTTSTVAHTIDLRALEIEIAGPQSFLARNGSGSIREAYVVLQYDTKQVSLAEWGANALTTSFTARD